MRELQHSDQRVFRNEFRIRAATLASIPVRVAISGEWRPLWLLLAVCFLGLPVSAQAQIDDDGFLAVVAEFADANFREKESIAEQLLDTGHASVRSVLTALLEGRFFFRQEDQQPFIVESTDEELSTYALIDPVSLEEAGSAEPDQLDRVITNNRLRRFLRITIARFALSSPDADIRVDAVKQMLRSLDDASVELLREHAAEEADSDVSYEIDTALALADLDGDEPDARLAAVNTLADRLNPDVYNRLSALLERDEDGSFIEADEDLRFAAAEAVSRIDRARTFYSIIETAFFGLSLGSVLAAGSDRLNHYVRRQRRHQSGPRRVADAWGLHDLRRATPDARAYRSFTFRGYSRRVYCHRLGGRAHRTDNHSVSLRPTARDATGDVWG